MLIPAPLKSSGLLFVIFCLIAPCQSYAKTKVCKTGSCAAKPAKEIRVEKKIVKVEVVQEKPVEIEQAKIDTEKFIKTHYETITGFGIPQGDENLIVSKGGAPTYGEIECESCITIFNDLPESVVKNGVFYDYGSGVGKMCVQAYFDYPFKKVVGIELSRKRHDGAMKILNKIKDLDLLDPNRTLNFIQGDFLETPTNDATVIYMCATCYSNELMLNLVKKFSKLKKGLHVITLKELPEFKKYGFELVKEYKLPMSWSRDTGGSPVHVYKLVGKSGKKAKKPEKKQEANKTSKKA